MARGELIDCKNEKREKEKKKKRFLDSDIYQMRENRFFFGM